MPITYYTEADYQELKRRVESLQKELIIAETRVKAIDVSVADQIKAGALLHLWGLLNAGNQTEAVARIKQLNRRRE